MPKFKGKAGSPESRRCGDCGNWSQIVNGPGRVCSVRLMLPVWAEVNTDPAYELTENDGAGCHCFVQKQEAHDATKRD